MVPTITGLTATRVDGDVPSTWGIYVQTKSKAVLTINGASGSYGYTITSYSIAGGGFAGTSNTMTTGFLNNAGTITFTATVTDSRGRTSAAKTVSISVVSYSVLSFSSYLSQRCSSSATLADDGIYIKASVSYSYSSCSGKNSVTRATYYRKIGDAAWTNANKSFASGTAFTFGSGNISTESTYEIKYSLTDAFTTISVIDTVSTVAVIMDFKSGGTITACTPASIIRGVCTDYVVESGMSGIWTYRKWNSGIAECWGIYSASGVNLTASYYRGFYYSASISVNLPFAFAAAPVGTYSGGCTSYITFVTPTGQPTTTQARFWIACLDAGAKSCSVSVGMMICGRWK